MNSRKTTMIRINKLTLGKLRANIPSGTDSQKLDMLFDFSLFAVENKLNNLDRLLTKAVYGKKKTK